MAGELRARVNGRWRLQRLLGEGADATAWAAVDERDGSPVALKALKRLDSPEARERFRWEFAALAAIRHPNLLEVFDLDRAQEGGPLVTGQPFFTSELLDGRPPADALAGLAPAARARALCQLLGEVASALDALHRRAVVHHDVKPGNLLVDAAGTTRLADLGLGAARGIAGALRGTPAYLAPEAFYPSADAGDPRVDLYALGATAFELWSGRPLRAGASLAELLRQSVQPPPLLEGAPTGLAELVTRMLAPDPAGRPSSARRVVEEALRLGARLDGALDDAPAMLVLHRPRLVGRETELAAASAALDSANLLLVEGAPGSGRSRLVEELRRAGQLAAAARGEAPPAWHGPTLAAALRTLDPDRAAGADERSQRARIARLCDRLQASPAVLHLDLGDRTPSQLDPLERELFDLIAHGAIHPSRLVAELAPAGELPFGTSSTSAGLARIRLEPLAEAATLALVASMIGSAAPAFGRAVQRASGGQPRLVVELVRGAAARARPGALPTADELPAVDGADLGALVLAAIRRLAEPPRRLVEALAALGRPASIDELARLADLDAAAAFAAGRTAETAGILELDGHLARFPSRAHAAAATGATAPARRTALHRLALARVPDDASDRALADRARHLAVLGPPLAASRAALAAGHSARDHFELARAEQAFADALRFADEPLAIAARLGLADVRTLRADYTGALEALAPLGETPLAALAAARALQRAGDHPAAEARLRAILSPPVDPGAARGVVYDTLSPADEADARGLYGRVLLARGAYAEAAEACAPTGAASAALDEARGLALYYLGRLDEAELAFDAIERDASGSPILRARARSLSGMVAQARDQLPRAASAYDEALRLARSASDLHGAAIYAANLGAILREQAEYERALPPTREAARDLGRLGKRVERAGALFNYGNLLLSIGDLEGADRAAAEALALADACAAPRERGYAYLLQADIARRRRQLEGAVAGCRAAEAAFGPHEGAERVLALRNLAEVLAEAAQAKEARLTLQAALATAARTHLEDLVAIAAVRVPLDLGDRPPPDAVDRLAAWCDHAARTGRRYLAFRAGVTLARARVRAGDLRRAADSLADADRTWKEIRMRTPELRRDAAAEDPDARRLRELVAAAGPPAAPAATPPAPAVDPARRLLAINKRLNSELRLPRLLELILDTVIELTSAERGFVLLGDGEGSELKIKVARNIDQQSLERGEASFSRSIAERAAREAAPIVTLDAAGDERFEAALSVSDLKLRSVLAVPLSVKGRVVGCVYADHRLRAGAFGDADVALVCDLAEQAAIAIENARLLTENERQRREVADLNHELERKVADQALELGELHKEVRQGRAALTIRYNYENLVGRTPRMLELFRLLDRVTDTALPVVIYGESGTGKELVARAIHHNGPRRSSPFISESCGAIPETLLEAALFGHVRGAFTGADAERRGLFEVASGGTLFLDEVGEMPASMQVKLLRVLQTGEFRRVGGERTLKVDVRVLVASNRDLGRMVEEGRFREDLFYRLNVVRVALPPLRERRDDVPLLVEHFLRKHSGEAGAAPRKIARAALQKLIGYRWPGNVRELENEVLRAAALGGEVIGVEDLSPQVAAGEPEAAFDSPDDLALKKRVERLERTLLREALDRSAGNQSQAARSLGLSRFGLQKKLRRYRMEA